MKSTIATLAIAVAVFGFAQIAPAQNKVQSSGVFSGKSDHIVKGTASIEKTEDGSFVVVLDEKFSLDGAPDPKVGLGKDGYKLKLAPLGKLTGKQTYKIPADVKVADFNEIWIWCEKFNVPLGFASLK